MIRYILITAALSSVIACSDKPSGNTSIEQPVDGPSGMVWIPAGEFTMGTNDDESYAQERPAHRVTVKGFWMDQTEVTNRQFKDFVEATSYVTSAERKPTWDELKQQLPPGVQAPPDSVLVPGALVFNPPAAPVMLNDYTQWWLWLPGADWQHPEGPASNLDGRANHPVVHVSFDDAQAYCKWKNRRLPTEAEWEYASRGGKEQQRYAWGEELNPHGKFVANTYQGSFPAQNTLEDGFESTAPVEAFPANAYGLYDMIGNVWEWTSDRYNVRYYSDLAKKGIAKNPHGPDDYYDPNEPYAMKRVTKGGSFLCAENYCSNFRPSARQGTAFDSGMSNVGFRCAKNK